MLKRQLTQTNDYFQRFASQAEQIAELEHEMGILDGEPAVFADDVSESAVWFFLSNGIA